MDTRSETDKAFLDVIQLANFVQQIARR